MSKQLFEQQQELTMINQSNLPYGFNEERYYKEVNTQQSRAFRVKRVEPLTDAEREAQAEAFKYIDEYDKRSRGQQFQ
jgi:coenzyme F420-reducing hydrogenase alpha subunit